MSIMFSFICKMFRVETIWNSARFPEIFRVSTPDLFTKTTDQT